MKTYAIAAIPGDGIGTEVVSAGVEVLHALAQRDGSFEFKVDHFPWGSAYYKQHGIMMPENGRDHLLGRGLASRSGHGNHVPSPHSTNARCERGRVSGVTRRCRGGVDDGHGK